MSKISITTPIDIIKENNVENNIEEIIMKKIKNKNFNFTKAEMNIITKDCKECKTTKKILEFYKNATGTLGRHANCISCLKKTAKLLYQKKKEAEGKKYTPYSANVVIGGCKIN